jgi:ribonucleoside-diphosphate reductase alpha chain
MPTKSTLSSVALAKEDAAGAKTFTAEEKNACSIDAMLNGGTCEACQ